MIARYARPEMARVWSDTRRLERWLEVELPVTAARERRGELPAGTSARIRQRARIDAARMAAIEAEVGHDVIAFLSMVAESVGDDARHLHAGLTSSDVVDTALALQMVEAGGLIREALAGLQRAAYALAERHRATPMVGRTHGVHAEPITFGLKCLSWSEELGRDGLRLADAVLQSAVGKLSGAVGTLAHLELEVEEEVLAAIARHLRAQDRNEYQAVYIVYYLPEMEPDAAANNLRVTVNRLTKALEPDRPDGAPPTDGSERSYPVAGSSRRARARARRCSACRQCRRTRIIPSPCTIAARRKRSRASSRASSRAPITHRSCSSSSTRTATRCRTRMGAPSSGASRRRPP